MKIIPLICLFVGANALVTVSHAESSEPRTLEFSLQELIEQAEIESTGPIFWRATPEDFEVALDAGGEAFVAPAAGGDEELPVANRRIRSSFPVGQLRLYVSVGKEEKASGTLYIGDPGGDSVVLPFTQEMGGEVPAEDFQTARTFRYLWMSAANLPGKAWFHFQALDDSGEATLPRDPQSRSTEELFRYMSGGLAVSENLAFDRALPEIADDGEEAMIPLEDLRGVTVPPFDWSGMIPEEATAPGGLAEWVPADQYWLSIPSLESVQALFAMSSDRAVPLLTMLPMPGSYDGLYAKYEKQMGLEGFRQALLARDDISAQIALTGGDPFFPTGTDVALLLESEEADTIGSMIEESLSSSVTTEALQTVSIEGKEVTFAESEDRSVSVYVSRLSETVWAVSNSKNQMERLIQTGSGSLESISSLEETRYFRSVRYPEEAGELLFLLLSDDAIRKWASPGRRIVNARRLEAAARLMEATAKAIPQWAEREDITLGQIRSELPADPVFNQLRFLTPVSEIPITEVTPAEKAAYERWRRAYERGWGFLFDPIAFRVSQNDEGMEVGLSVIPLRVDSEYNRMIGLTGDAEIREDHRSTPSSTLAILSMALDIESAPFLQYENLAGSFFPQVANQPFAWIDESVSVFATDSLLWDALALSSDPSRAFERAWAYLPVGLRVESKSSLRLAGFLTGLRAIAQQSAPGLVRWDTREVEGRPYSAILPIDPGSFEDLSIFYQAAPDALTVTTDESIIRDQAVMKPEDGFAGIDLQGEHLNLEWTEKAIGRIGPILGDALHNEAIGEQWRWIPVLNEWRNLFPAIHPADLHAALWAEPVPGTFIWEEKTRSMVSADAGSPSDPVNSENQPLSWVAHLGRGAMGLTFSEDGLEAKSVLLKRVTPAEESEIEDNAGEEVVTEGYYPLNDGLSYTYQTVYDDGEEVTDQVTVESLESDGEEGQLFVLTTQEITGEEPFQWTEVLRQTKEVRVVSYDYEDGKEFLDPSLLLMPSSIVPGREIISGSRIRDEQGRQMGFEVIAMKFAGFETIEVGAGVFEDCLRLETRSLNGYGGDLNGWTGSDWYAKGVGLVRSEWSDSFSAGSTELLEVQSIKE